MDRSICRAFIGTVVSLIETSTDNFTVSQGSTSLNRSGFSMLGGDNIFAYKSSSGVEPPNPNFIAGILGDDNYLHSSGCDNANNWFDCTGCSINGSNCSTDSGDTPALPSVLTNGTDAIALFPNTSEKDNAKYTGILTGTVSDVRAAINDYTNWTTNDDPINITSTQYSGINITIASGPSLSDGPTINFNTSNGTNLGTI